MQFAEAHGHSLLELAVSWLACRPGVVSVIAGAKSATQVKTNEAAASWKLANGELAGVERVLREGAARAG